MSISPLSATLGSLAQAFACTLLAPAFLAGPPWRQSRAAPAPALAGSPATP